MNNNRIHWITNIHKEIKTKNSRPSSSKMKPEWILMNKYLIDFIVFITTISGDVESNITLINMIESLYNKLLNHRKQQEEVPHTLITLINKSIQ